MSYSRPHPHNLTLGLLLAIASSLWMSGCKGPRELSKLPVYSEDFQRSYFEAQNHLAKGDSESAYSGFMQCLELEPQEGALYFSLGKIDLELKRWEASLEHFDKAHQLQPENRWYREFRAKSFVQLKRFNEAKEDLLWILAQRPGDFEWAMEWTLQLANAGGIETALKLCEAYEETAPNEPDVLLQKLYLMELKQDYLGIYRSLEAAVLQYPEHFEFKLQWAQMLLATDQKSEALEVLLELQNQNPHNGLVQLELAEIWTSRNEIEKAQQALVIAFDSDDILVEEKHDILVQYLRVAAFSPEVIDPLETLMERAIMRHGDNGHIRMLASDLAQILGQTEAANHHMRLAVVAIPHIPTAWSNLIALDAEIGDYQAMLKHAEEAMERFPLEAEFGLLAGISALQLGQTKDAIRGFRLGLGVVHDTPVIEGKLAGFLGDALHEIGDVEGAEAAYERSLSKAPNDPTFLNNHAYRLAQRKHRLERALDCSSLAVQIAPEEANFLDTHAWVLYQMGRYPEALDYITQALFLASGNDATFWEHDGDIRSAMGDLEGALKSWKTALNRGGNKGSLLIKIGD